MTRRKRIVWSVSGIAMVAALGLGARAATGVLVPAGNEIPTGKVTRGTLKADLVTTGEIKAAKTDILVVPPTGGALRILTLVPSGTRVKKGDTVVTFDPTDQQNTVEEQRSVLREAQLEIARTQATSAARQAQDELDLQTARYDLRKAELDVQASEVRAPLDARKAQLTLEEARNRLAQLEGDRASRSQSDQAALAVAREKETKAQLAIQVATTILSQMVLNASMDGVVAVKDNLNINFGYQGMTLNEHRVGDQVQAGAAIAEVLDLGQLEIGADIDENDRARLSVGQAATLTLDALGGRPIPAKVTSVGTIMPQRFFGPGAAGPSRMFSATLALAEPATDLRPGLTGRVTISGAPQVGVLHVPRGAVFERDGGTVVFVGGGLGGGTVGGFTPTPVKVLGRTESSAVIEGVAEGTTIALADPSRRAGSASTPAAAGPAMPAAAPGGRR
jgi:multidrug efflux pump subunit AcrA (membrane-fusion protein)